MGKIVAVTGATGYVGRFVVPLLARQGIEVRVLARPTSNRDGFPAGIDWVLGDLLDPIVRQTLVSRADVVVHLAYSHVPGRYRGGEGDDLSAWLSINLTGTLELMLEARNASVAQFIFLSSRAVFSHTEKGRVLDESHPTSPDTHYGAYKAAIESMLRSFGAVEGMQTTAVRATGIYGLIWPVEQSKWWHLIQSVMADKVDLGNRGGTEVHGRDVARTILKLVQSPELAPDIVHLSDLYVTNRRIVEIAREIANRPGPLPPPSDTAMTNVLVCNRLSELGIELGGEPLLRETIRELVRATESQQVH
ncbi:MAG: NAD(P)-dependent oxidoreductase [Chloroflexota bacterium]